MKKRVVKDSIYTEWYEMNQKPKRPGVYQIALGKMKLYSNWDGTFWGTCTGCVESSDAMSTRKGFYQMFPWRGLKRENRNGKNR